MKSACPCPAGDHSTRQWLARSTIVLPPSSESRTNEFSPVITTSWGSTIRGSVIVRSSLRGPEHSTSLPPSPARSGNAGVRLPAAVRELSLIPRDEPASPREIVVRRSWPHEGLHDARPNRYLPPLSR